MVEHERVALRVAEERHVTDARVEDVAFELDSLVLQRAARVRHVRDAQRDVRAVRLELRAVRRRVDEVQADVAGLDLRPRAVPRRALHAERVAVERLRPLDVLDRHGHEVGPLDGDQPTDPSIWSWIRRFISTAYSSGSSFVIGSTKPETTIADASASERPRDMR